MRPSKSTFVDAIYPGGPFPGFRACGHETHAAILMGAAEVLADMRDQIPGTAALLFQAVEEGPPVGEDGGAAVMIKDGRSPAYVDGFHDGRHSGTKEAGNDFDHSIRDEERLAADADDEFGRLAGEADENFCRTRLRCQAQRRLTPIGRIGSTRRPEAVGSRSGCQ